MSFFSNLMGNAIELNPTELQSEFANVLIDGENIEAAFKIFRDK
ncbi:MAG: PH domain-containing protein [Bacteroidota bacterium]